MKKILFVCTGNTCRSFMAEVILKNIIKDAVEKGLLLKNKYEVSSAGIYAMVGEEANLKAKNAMEYMEYGKQIHNAKQLTKEQVESSCLILTMTEEHKHFILKAFPNSQLKTHTFKAFAFEESNKFDDFDIIDPYGGTFDDYIKCANEIKKSSEALIPILHKLTKL